MASGGSGQPPGGQIPWPPPPPAPNDRGTGPPMGPPFPRGPPRLTPEESRVLRECSTESFWYRCVPLGALLIGGTQIMVKRGIWTAHPKYGTVIKSLGAGLVGFIVGKFSYQKKCREKILRLENSPLAEAMRKGRGGREVFRELGMGPGGPRGPYYGPGPQMPEPEQRSMQGPNSHLNMDMSRGENKGLPDSSRPTMDNGGWQRQSAAQEPAQNQMTYEDLRRRNREDYDRRMASMQQQPHAPNPSQPSYPPSQSYAPRPSAAPRPRTNQYGDVVEE